MSEQEKLRGSTTGASSSNVQENLLVALRIRPINEDEIIEGATPIAHKVDSNLVVLMDPLEDPDDILRANRSREKKYVFDLAFDGSTSQGDVYDAVCKPIIPSVIDGFNATVFAYGATGAGKTYTMLGTEDDLGIMARAINDLFLEMEETKDDMNYEVKMSYLEIYNEMIRDLLNPTSGFLELRDDGKSVVVAHLSEVKAKSTGEVINMLQQGNKERTQEPTAANKASSRSHAVLQVTVTRKNRIRDLKQEMRVGKLFLIDLAGSERAANTQNRGKRMKEGAHINRSLLALGNCINALSERGGSKYVNYRDSKLTRLLKDALGGNCKTVMIANISPASIHFEESRNTLVYADRAKNIKTKITRNLLDVSYHISQYTNIISELREEIKRLKSKLDEQQHSRSMKAIKSGMLLAARKGEQADLNKLKDELLLCFQDQMELRKTLMELRNTDMEISLESTRQQLVIKEYEREKARKKNSEDDAEDNKMKEERRVTEKAFLTEAPDEGEPEDIKMARDQLLVLDDEKNHTEKVRHRLEKELQTSRSKAARLEEVIPTKINSEEQQEIWSLLCKVHELEIENLEMQSSCLMRDLEIRKRDMIISKNIQHHNLCDEIIQQQRVLIDVSSASVPGELEELYELYVQEVKVAEETELSLEIEPDNIAAQKFQSLASLRRSRDVDSVSDNDHYRATPVIHREPHTLNGVNSVARKKILRRSNNIMPKYEENNKEALFSQSPKAREIKEAQRKEARKIRSKGPVDLRASQKRQSSVITLNSSQSSTNQSPTPRDKNRLIVDDDHLERATIISSTRNIAALALQKRKTRIQHEPSSERPSLSDGAFNKTFISMSNVPTDKNDGTVFLKPTKDNYLTPSRLAIHDKKYGTDSPLKKLNMMQYETGSNATAEPQSDIIHNRPKKKGQQKSKKRYINKKTNVKRLNSPDVGNDHAKYSQMTPEAFFRKLAKSSLRKLMSDHPSHVSHRKSRIPAPVDKNSRALVPGNAVLHDDLLEFGSAKASPTVVYQTGQDKGRGQTIQRRVRAPRQSESGNSSPLDGNNNKKTGKKAASKSNYSTIPNYRTGDITVAGFSLHK